MSSPIISSKQQRMCCHRYLFSFELDKCSRK